jgi:hypothetical protein
MSPRIKCCVPCCDRTCRNDGNWLEWICPSHWRRVPKRYRRIHVRALRRMKPGLCEILRNEVPVARINVHDRIWRRVKRAAIEHAVGLR